LRLEGALASRDFKGLHIPSSLKTELCADLSWSVVQLLVHLVPYAKFSALPPISQFFVGAAALGASGDIYLGVNLEFVGSAINQTIHAEQCLVTLAAQHKEARLERLQVSAAPCGHCRQFLNETQNGLDMVVAYEDVEQPLGTLLPHSFGPADLGNFEPLLSNVGGGLNKLQPDLHQPTPLVDIALQAATCSYAPYSGAVSAVAVQLRSGEVFSGFYIENCAYNPSMPPLQAALIAMVGQGYGLHIKDIAQVVLVERTDTAVRQLDATQALLKQCTNNAQLITVTLA